MPFMDGAPESGEHLCAGLAEGSELGGRVQFQYRTDEIACRIWTIRNTSF